jgi:myo-inositol-1(or 4)-monophosphatase
MTPSLSLPPVAYARLDANRADIGGVSLQGGAEVSCAWVACGRLTG